MCFWPFRRSLQTVSQIVLLYTYCEQSLLLIPFPYQLNCHQLAPRTDVLDKLMKAETFLFTTFVPYLLNIKQSCADIRVTHIVPSQVCT